MHLKHILLLAATCEAGLGTVGNGIVAVGAVAGYDSAVIVTQGHSVLVERLGKFHRCLGPGLHFKIPLVERIAAHKSIRERVCDVPAQRCITADNAPLTADAVVFYRIRDLVAATYSIDDFEVGLSNLILTQLRSEIGQLTLDQTFSAREQLNEMLLKEANKVTEKWGVDVVRVEVRDILPSPEIVAAMELQMSAERHKRAAILESEGRRTAKVNAAEADRDAVVLAAEGERQRLVAEAAGLAASIQTIADALEGADESRSIFRNRAAKLMLDRASIAATLSLAQSPNAKVVVAPGGGSAPNNNDALTSAALTGSTLGLAQQATYTAPPRG